MAHIKSIRFSSVGKQNGCTCDRCGQYIRNIWTVEYREGLRMNYGLDCWEKVCKEGLNEQGLKEIRKIMKSVENYEKRLELYTSGEMAEDTDESYKTEQADCNRDSYWYGRSFEEYKSWMVNEFFPYRISKCQDELARFRKIDFKE